MIVPMLKANLLCLPGDRQPALERLRELGVLHVTPTELRETSDRSELGLRHVGLERALNFLSSIKDAPPPASVSPEQYRRAPARHSSLADSPSGQAVAEQVIAAMDRLAELDKENEALQRDRERLLPWGDFDPQKIRELRNSGIYVYLCAGTNADLQRLPPEAVAVVIHQTKDRAWFAVVSPEPMEESSLPLAPLPAAARLADVEARLCEIRETREEINAELAALRPALPQLHGHRDEVAAELEFLRCRDAMAERGPVLALAGYVPEPDADHLRTAAQEHAWGLLLQKPGSDELPPVKIVMPKIFRMVEPLFGFMGIAPGYREWDVSVCFLFFFTLFFGMIIGDAGYGAIFLVLTLYLRHRRPGPEMRLPVRLLATLSAVTIIWGLLTGNLFGIPAAVLPVWLRGVPALTGEAGDRTIKFLCFLIAAGHLSLARGWKALLAFPAKQAFGEIGWALLIWANFFVAVALIVTGGSVATWVLGFYAVGIVLILACGVNWRDLGEILNTPFGLIGSFVDLLSYIRLYALGLSTYYIASSFNGMGLMVLDFPDMFQKALSFVATHLPNLVYPSVVVLIVLAIAFMIIVLLLGHGLNLAMGIIAVLVHAIRLNTLEFSNHMGLTWSGTPYAPFRRRETPPAAAKPNSPST